MLAKRTLVLCIGLLVAAFAAAADDGPSLRLTLRSRVPARDTFKLVNKGETWYPDQTAIIVCDMWDQHHCLNAALRVKELAPAMNDFLTRLRGQGALIIHAPSSCMATYKDHPGRKLAQKAPGQTNLPADIGIWCNKIPSEEKGKYPLDQSDGGCDSEPAAQAKFSAWLKEQGRDPKAPWLRQIDTLAILDGDAISDSGVEIWNLLQARGIKNVMLVGVHANMCVLGRPFGLRQLARNGKHVVLVRDLTDTMYNPASWPHVAHFRGTELIIEHIEKYVCPTISSDQVLGGQPFRFGRDEG